jgi:hypothetical protein
MGKKKITREDVEDEKEEAIVREVAEILPEKTLCVVKTGSDWLLLLMLTLMMMMMLLLCSSQVLSHSELERVFQRMKVKERFV